MLIAAHIIADDLTGLLEAVQSLAITDVRIQISPEHSSRKHTDSPRLINANIRDAKSADALDIIRRLTRDIPEESYLFLKIDSLLRGPIKSMIMGLRELQRPIIFAPATPGRQRTTRDLKMYVNDVPLKQSGTWNIETTTPPESLEDILVGNEYGHLPISAIRREPHILASAIQEQVSQNSVIACDAESSIDLDRIALATRSLKPRPVFVGSAGLLSSLRSHWFPPARHKELELPPAEYQKPILFILGSAASTTFAQYKSIDREGLVIYDDALSGASMRASFANSEDLIVPPRAKTDAKGREARQNELEKIVRRVPPLYKTLFMTGGETAFRVLALLGVTKLRCIGFADSGLAVMKDNKNRSIIIKPGEYGQTDLLNMVRRAGAT